tara:strand:- start:10777 stop:11529 length:753 start_codon:yes stop_codon:yes gene_type:complete
MKSLIRNCTHGSEIFLLEEIDSSGNVRAIFKASSSPDGVENLRQELRGFKWYNSRHNRKIEVVVEHETGHYIRIKYEYLKGFKSDFRNGYWRNKNWIVKAIDHYCDIWGSRTKGSGELFPLHGDLSLDNYIFMDNGPIILDWEHFSERAAPLGFDGLYLIFEALWFEIKNKTPQKKTLSHLKDMIALMHDRDCLDHKYILNPLSQIIQFIQTNSSLWGTQLKNCVNKLPILLFEKQAIDKIDRGIKIKVG